MLTATPALYPDDREVVGFIYVANAALNTISQFRVTASGRLVPLLPPQVPSGDGPKFVDISPNGKYAYTINDDDNTVSQFRISSGGILKALTLPTAPTGNGLVRHLHFSADGRHAYAANLFDDTISQYRIGINGALCSLNPPTVPTQKGPKEVFLVPGAHFLCAANAGDPVISRFRITNMGRLIPLAVTTIRGKGADDLCYTDDIVFSRDGHYMYASYRHRHASNSFIGDYRIGQNGNMTLVNGVQDALPATQFLNLGTDGRSLYTRAGSQVYQYHVQPNGRLKALRPASIPLSGNALGLATLGSYMYMTEVSNGSVVQFHINRDGSLSLLSPPTIMAGGRPQGIVVDAAVRCAYVVDSENGVILQYKISADGSLSPLSPPVVAVGKGALSITFSPGLR